VMSAAEVICSQGGCKVSINDNLGSTALNL
jgi:hypothetical protein